MLSVGNMLGALWNPKRWTLIVSDVPGAAAFFADALGLRLTANEDRFARLTSAPAAPSC
jgi:hypothetical protein